MLAAAERWGGGRGRAALPGTRLLDRPLQRRRGPLPAGGRRPGHAGGCASCGPAIGLWVLGPLGQGFTAPQDGRRALLVGGGVGIAPLAILQDELAREDIPAQVLLGFRDGPRARGAALLRAAQVATDDGSAGHHGLVTDLLVEQLDETGTQPSTPAGRRRCWRRSGRSVRRARSRRQLALEAGMACGFGACYGCVVPRRGGGYLRVCVDGPVIDAAELDQRRRSRRRRAAMSVEFCGLELAHPIVNGSGTFDALAARRAFGAALDEQFPFAAYVSKTITLAAPRRQSAAAAVGDPGGTDQLDRTAEQGPRGLSGRGSARAGEPAGAADHERDGLERGRDRRARTGLRRARRDRGDRAERVVPQREDGPRHRGRSAPAGAGRAHGARADEQAADREADAERGRCRGLCRGGAGGRRRRGVADQHAARARARAGVPRRDAVAPSHGWGVARAVYRAPRSAPSRSPKWRPWPRAWRSPRSGWAGSAALRMHASCSMSARVSSPSARRASAIPPRARGSRGN